ncbi:tripartite motif-containing protein 2-like [Mytilus trossulus]|uniref:tripartite motif-containing protein 2-like n=1 Tax=Mytilus trossulus TaxID=6551 RepID=UPI003003CF1A
MDQSGNHLIEYETDINNKPLFTLPTYVTSTSSNNICVVDRLLKNAKGRIVVIGQEGNIKGIYTGHDDVNTEDKPFIPLGILVTQSDNILVVDWAVSVVRILNSDGEFISYLNVYNLGIQYPHSIALSTPGKLYIGCGRGEESLKNDKAKLYEVEYSGV